MESHQTILLEEVASGAQPNESVEVNRSDRCISEATDDPATGVEVEQRPK